MPDTLQHLKIMPRHCSCSHAVLHVACIDLQGLGKLVRLGEMEWFVIRSIPDVTVSVLPAPSVPSQLALRK